MEKDYSLYSEVFRETKREMEKKHERMMEEMEHEKAIIEALGISDLLMQENDNLKEDVKSLQEELEQARQQLAEEKKGRAELEMKMAEMSKLSAGVAKKASQDDLFKAFRQYLNISKRKTLSKREAAKTVFMELFTTAKLDLPEDIMELLSHLDDEEPSQAPVTNVNVSAGGINVQQANSVQK
ncbi:MAG: hypothetical protein IKW91_08005 [Bacteroidaceae bacterium]|nr:hypothetical protein [Bacteroidaceae bacterium]